MKRAPFVLLFAFSACLIAIIAALANIQPANSQTSSPTPTLQTLPPGPETTLVRVYVLSRGGKFLGDDIGGARVTLRDAHTGEFLASGRTQGGSGADDLMTAERPRTEPINRQDAAVFTATLELDLPRLVQFEASGPLGAQNAENIVTATEWVLPGSVAENEIVIEVPGLNLQVLNPPTHFMPRTKPPLDIPVRVNLTMMCGCPIAPDTEWKPENFIVKAMVVRPDGTRELFDLSFDPNAPDGAPSQFAATYTAAQSGIYQLVVMAHQFGEDNVGSNHITFIIP